MIKKLARLFKGTIGNELDDTRGVISKKIIASYLPANPVIVEAGAHIGSDTIEMANLWRRSQIYAFEPVPKLFAQLTINTKKYKNIIVFPKALGIKNGFAKMHISSGSSDASSSLLKPKEHLSIHPTVYFDETVLVPTITLDTWSAEKGLKVDFLWLDLQGMELEILKRGEKMLNSVRAIYTEVNLLENYKGAKLYDVLKSWLFKKGFNLQLEAIPWEDVGNALFVRKYTAYG